MLLVVPSPILALQNRELIVALGCAVAAQLIIGTVSAIWAVRKVINSNAALAQHYQQLREETLANFVDQQRVENARVVADTRAATARMNVMADALLQGLLNNKRDIEVGLLDRDGPSDH